LCVVAELVGGDFFDFIPVSEQIQGIAIADASGLLIVLGERILATACRDAARLQGGRPCRVSVNAAASQLRHAGFVKAVEDALASSRLDPRLLELEITEDSLVEHGSDDVAMTLNAIGALGVHIAIDDFGTGYSSLAYLKRLPIDTVKIDRSFVSDLPGDPDACAIVGAIIALSHQLGLRVVAEGVETPAQLDYLRDHGCDEVQGFLLRQPSLPTPTKQLTARRRSWMAALGLRRLPKLCNRPRTRTVPPRPPFLQ